MRRKGGGGRGGGKEGKTTHLHDLPSWSGGESGGRTSHLQNYLFQTGDLREETTYPSPGLVPDSC